MSQQDSRQNSNTMKRSTAIIFMVVSLFIGFYLGTVFFSIMSESASSPVTGPPQSSEPDRTAEFQQDILELEKIVLERPEDLAAWTRLGHLYFDTNQPAKAIWAYEKSLELDPDNANVWTDLGVMYRRNNEPQKAIDAFNKAVEIDPTHEIARFNKGIVYLHDLNDREAALKSWNELVVINPSATTPNGKPVRELIQELSQVQ